MRTLFFLISIFACTILYGGIDVQSDSLYGSQLVTSAAPLDVKGSRYNALQTQSSGTNPTFWINNAFGLVKLSYPAYTSASSYPVGTASVGVSITYEKFENGTFFTKTTNTTLTLNFQSGSFSNASYLKLPNAQHLTVTVTSVNIPSGLSLSLQVSIETNSFNILSQSLPSSFAIQPAAPTASDSSLLVSWPSVSGAQSFDLEWTYISDQDSSLTNPSSGNTQPYYYNRLNPNSIEVDPYLFRYNSTRVSVDTVSLSYKIPLLYEQGIIVYRVRAVGQSIANNTPIYMATAWTAQDGQYDTLGGYYPNFYKYNGHEQSLNWQYSLSLAEQGKNKAVLSYYDGSSRNRQAVTRINSDQRIIIGETLYDYNGRPVIQMLPVPTTLNQILYYPNFNLITGESFVNKSDYDIAQQGNGCAKIAPTFSTTTGSSQYYSSSNNFDTLGNTGSHLLNRNLIPDAQLYPYTQTLYTPDNTGRIAAQSGVGLTHIIGSNKETRYLYGSPQQPELSRLFGNQVGYASHYKKNAVIDANGQTSVSYLNMEGKVVATALAGDNPPNLDTLGDNANRTVSSDLIASSGGISNILSPDGLTKTFNTKFPVTGQIAYTFNYQGTVGSYNVTCDTNSADNILYPIDGVVDVQLTLNDQCGNSVFNKMGSTQAGNTGNTQTVSIPVSSTVLQAGEYQLVKTLSIDEVQLEAYWNTYLDTNNCLYSSDYFVQTQMAQIDITGCGLTCNTCEHKRDSILAASNNLTSDQKSQLSHICDTICNDYDITCLSALQAMQGDMSPDGQYGQVTVQNNSVTFPGPPSTTINIDSVPSTTSPSDITINQQQDSSTANNSNTIDPTQFPISIFNDRNNLRLDSALQSIASYPSWRYPIQVSNTSIFNGANETNEILFSGINLKQGLNYSITDYKNSDGSTFYVNVTAVYTSHGSIDSTVPNVTDTTKLILINKASKLYKVPARYLKNFTDFFPYWQQNWANYLIPYHPEYQYFIQCTSQQQSNNFIYRLSNTTTAVDAQSAGLLNLSTGTPTILQADTFIKNNTAYLGYMQSRTTYYDTITISGVTQEVTMAQMATIANNCPRLQTNCGMPDCTNGIINTDDEWNTYKGYYLAERQILTSDQAAYIAVQGKYYNGCIGHSDFISDPDDYYFTQPTIGLQPVNISYRRCFAFICHTYSATEYQFATSYPYLNPAQVCFNGTATYYANKVQRFYATASSSTAGANPPKYCTITTPNAVSGQQPIQIRVPCNADLDSAINQMAEAAYSFKYTSCGECPIASDVEQFIMDLRGNGLLLTDTTSTANVNLLVSCDQDNNPVSLGEVLRNLEIPKTDPQNPVIYWTSKVTPAGNGNLLTGILYNDSTTSPTIYDTISLWIPNSVPVSFNKLTQLCCLSVNTSGSTLFFPYKPNKVFTLQGAYSTGGLTQNTFVAEGTTSFPLALCTFSPNCQLSNDASNVVTFLNTLAIYNPSIDPTKQQNLIATPSVNLASSGIIDYYNSSVINLIGKNNTTLPGQYVESITSLNPSWQSSVSNDTLFGVLTTYFTDSTVKLSSNTYKVDTINTVIQITGLPLSYQYSSVSIFNNLRPAVVSSSDICTTQPCQKTTFVADAIIANNQEQIILPVNITVPGLIPVVCTPALPPSNSN